MKINPKDRGNKKWNSLFLVEHTKRLRELKEHEEDQEKPILDDQDKEVINYRLQQALQNNLAVEIKYYDNKRFKTAAGRIDKVDINQKFIFINNKKIPLENLLKVELEQKSDNKSKEVDYWKVKTVKEYVVKAKVKGSSLGIGRITKTVMAEGKEETLNKFYELYDNPEPGNFGRSDIELVSIREVTSENRDSFH